MKELATTNKPNMQLMESTSASPKKEFALILIAASVLVLGLAAIIVYAILTQPKKVTTEEATTRPKVTETTPSSTTKPVESTPSSDISGSDEITDLEGELDQTEIDALDGEFTELEGELNGL